MFAVISIAIGASAQSYTQRWNDLYKRTEFFDSYGRMTVSYTHLTLPTILLV